MNVYEDFTTKILEYDLETEAYFPLISGDASNLLRRVESCSDRFPRAARLFGDVLRAGLQRHPLLEDWLMVIHYQFFWDRHYLALQQFEAHLNELIRFIGEVAWEPYCADVVVRTNCATTNDLLDRLYDIQLEMYGVLYLGRESGKAGFIPRSDDEKKPDIKGMIGGRQCVLECKFVHTSEKYENFFRRLDQTAYKYGEPKPPFILAEQCQFPVSKSVKALSPDDCLATKKFLKKICQDRSVIHIGRFKKKTFVYGTSLPPNLVTIDSQQKFAGEQADVFASSYLKRLLDEASLQLKKAEYEAYKKILFIGLQPDALYLAPWNESAISHAKSTFIPLAEKEGIVPVFSEDVGFSVRGYL